MQKQLLKYLRTNLTLFDSCKRDVSLENYVTNSIINTNSLKHDLKICFFEKVTVIVYDISMIIAIIKDNQRCVKRKRKKTWKEIIKIL